MAGGAGVHAGVRAPGVRAVERAEGGEPVSAEGVRGGGGERVVSDGGRGGGRGGGEGGAGRD